MQNLWVWPMLLDQIFLPENGNRSNFRKVVYTNILASQHRSTYSDFLIYFFFC